MGSYLGRDTILQADDIETREVDVQEWGGTVLIRALTGTERDAYEASMQQQRGKDIVRNFANVRAKLVVKCCIDADGNRLFADQDAPALGKKSAAALDRVFEACAELSRLSNEDIDELGKASDETPPDDSPSA